MEFLLFEDDASGPLSGNATKYVRWKQTDNPATTYYGNVSGATASDTVAGYEEIAKVGVTANFGGLALSSASPLLDGNPKHGNWWGAVASTAIYQDGIPVLNGSNRYSQLWVRLPSGDALTYGWGEYVEIVDIGALIPSTVITVTIDSVTLAGDPNIHCQIETSQDAEEWFVVAEDAFQAHAGEFQYVRYTISCTGGIISISNINYKLDVKRKSDFGHVRSNAGDNGAGYVNDQSTPMLKGTWVPFSVDFSDVSSLPKPNVVNHPEYTAYTVFEDVLYPKGFRVFVLDKNGNRVTADVDWSAFGV